MQRIARYFPHSERFLAYLILALAIANYACYSAFFIDFMTWIATFCICSYSLLWLLLLGILCALPQKKGRIATTIAMVLLSLAGIWLIASVTLYKVQGRALLWTELFGRLLHPSWRAYIFEMLFSWRLLVFLLFIVGGYISLVRFFRKWQRSYHKIALATIAVVAGAGCYLKNWPSNQIAIYVAPASAPWDSIHRPQFFDLHGGFLGHTLDTKATKEYFDNQLQYPFWQQGKTPILADLVQRYRGRSIFLFILESHRASNVAAWGKGSSADIFCSPYLTKLAGQGLKFNNYFGTGQGTVSAIWPLTTGLPNPPGDILYVDSYNADAVEQKGILQNFVEVGYIGHWMRSANPDFQNWKGLLTRGGFRWWIHRSDTEGLSQEYWTTLGVPDEQIFAIAVRYYQKYTQQQKPSFIAVLSVSNHHPFNLPKEIEGAKISRNNYGGMRYADFCLHQAVEKLRSLPQDQQPLIFITADTSNKFALQNSPPLYYDNLEAWRMPGLLITPDGYAAGKEFDGLFCHEDLLDLFALMVLDNQQGKKYKFKDFQRLLIGQQQTTSFSLVSRDHYYYGPQRKLFAIKNHWHLQPVEAEDPLIQEGIRRFAKNSRKLWPLKR